MILMLITMRQIYKKTRLTIIRAGVRGYGNESINTDINIID